MIDKKIKTAKSHEYLYGCTKHRGKISVQNRDLILLFNLNFHNKMTDWLTRAKWSLSFQNLGQQHYIFIMEVIKGPRLW
jgi:hypothetical protein